MSKLRKNDVTQQFSERQLDQKSEKIPTKLASTSDPLLRREPAFSLSVSEYKEVFALASREFH